MLKRILVVDDLTGLSASALYTGESCGPGNFQTNFDLGGGFALTERIDTTHGPVHINQDVTGINSGTSKKAKNADGYKGIGNVHNIPLFDKD